MTEEGHHYTFTGFDKPKQAPRTTYTYWVRINGHHYRKVRDTVPALWCCEHCGRETNDLDTPPCKG